MEINNQKTINIFQETNKNNLYHQIFHLKTLNKVNLASFKI